MINKKAPKDMTAVEFVEYLIARKEDEKVLDVNVYYTLEFLKGRLNEPAPNPFTPDQLAWFGVMRECGMEYAAMDMFDFVTVYEKKPVKKCASWLFNDGVVLVMPKSSFLNKVLTSDDPEPLCFADYAPLEEK